MSWSRLICFTDDDGKRRFGEPCINNEHDLTSLLQSNDLWAVELIGLNPYTITGKGERLHVKALAHLLRPAEVPIIRCIGLNYMKHIEEGGKTPPPYPSVFIKPSASVAGFNEDIVIPKVAQDDTLDYEGELGLLIGKTGKDIPESSALDFVAGYFVSNDVSNRDWQRNPKKAGGAPQWCFSKGFDKFAPIGPMLVSPSILGAAENLRLQTIINGEERQNDTTQGLLFGVKYIVSFCSQGTTLEAGSLILTGTPSGVAMGMKEPRYLQNGDIMEVKISHLGCLKNRVVYQS